MYCDKLMAVMFKLSLFKIYCISDNNMNKIRLLTKPAYGFIYSVCKPSQAAEELNCALFVHPWDMQTDGRMAKYWLPWLVGEYELTLTSHIFKRIRFNNLNLIHS